MFRAIFHFDESTDCKQSCTEHLVLILFWHGKRKTHNQTHCVTVKRGTWRNLRSESSETVKFTYKFKEVELLHTSVQAALLRRTWGLQRTLSWRQVNNAFSSHRTTLGRKRTRQKQEKLPLPSSSALVRQYLEFWFWSSHFKKTSQKLERAPLDGKGLRIHSLQDDWAS